MKVLILTKKNLLLVLSAIIASIILIFLSVNTFFFPDATNVKKIPIYRVSREDKNVSISFDAAWGNEQTNSILEILKENNVKATFFLVGNWVDKYPESVKSIHEGGHDIGNHSDTHPHMTKLEKEKMTTEIEECNSKIQKITGERPILFRAPYGDYNNLLIDVLTSLKMHCIQWDVDSLDWKNKTPEQMSKKAEKMTSGSIMLLHNGGKFTPKALPLIIKTIRDNGNELIPISQNIYKENYETTHDGTQVLKDQE